MLADQVLVAVGAFYTIVTVAGAVMFLWLRAGPPGNLLAWFLLAEGLGHLGIAVVVVNTATVGSAFQMAGYALVWPGTVLSTVLYLSFIGAAIQVPLARPLHGRVGATLLVVLLVGFMLLPFVWPWPVTIENAQIFLVLYAFIVLAATYGLAVALQLRRRAESGAARRQSAAYVAAFGVRDVAVALVYGSSFLFIFGVEIPWSDETWTWTVGVGFISTQIAFVFLLAYGALSGRILELDRRFRFGITQTTAVALVAGLFFVIVESVEQLLDFSNPVFSVAVAGGLFLLFRPVQRVSERLAARLVPAGKAISEMDADERLVAYQEQVELAHADGEISAAEERMLERFRTQLGLSTRQARRAADRVAS